MTEKLKVKDYFFIASLLFGLFFGAGNLIFPVFMGQEAGAKVFIANLGFLLTATGLPLLAVASIGVSNSESVFDLARKAGDSFGYGFTILLYLVIGPLFAIPRLATTSYEIALAPFVAGGSQDIALIIFSVLFFVVAWFFSRTSSSALNYVGKFLNPLFLITLGILLILAIVRPMGAVGDLAVQATYQKAPFFQGFLGGYNTLDALAGLAFGIIITSSVQELGVKKPREIAKSTIKSGLLTIILMAIIYTLLAWMGATSMHAVKYSQNGGELLARISIHYFGFWGTIVLALITTSACLTTAVGLITAFSSTFEKLFPKFTYRQYSLIATITAALIATAGLSFVLEITTPVLMFIYPLAIVLILLTFLELVFPIHKKAYQITLFATMLVSIIDALAAAPEVIQSQKGIRSLLEWSTNKLPLMDLGLSWVLPAAVGLVIGLIYTYFNHLKNEK